MDVKSILLLAIATVCASSAWGNPESLWHKDFGDAKAGVISEGCEVVDDAGAAGGKALRLSFVKDGMTSGVASVKELSLAGRGTLKLMIRGKDLNYIANGLQFTVNLSSAAGWEPFSGNATAYGIRCKEDSYAAFSVPFTVSDKPAKYRFSINATWQKQVGENKPIVWVGGMDLMANGDKAAYISGAQRGRIGYAPGDKAKLTVTVVNPTKDPFEGSLIVKEFHGADGENKVDDMSLSLSAGEVRSVEISWKEKLPESGREIGVALLDKSAKELDSDAAYIGVAKDLRQFSFPSLDFGGVPSDSVIYYVPSTSYSRMKNSVDRIFRNPDTHGGRYELFGWSQSDLAGFFPSEDPYITVFGSWMSLKNRKEQIALLKGIGYHVDSYILGSPSGVKGMELHRKRPDLFAYSKDGEFATYDMGFAAEYLHRNDFEYVKKVGPESGFCFIFFDPTNPEVRELVAKQIVSLRKDMGFDGLRWDGWFVSIWAGARRLDGTVIARDLEEADRLSAESLKAVKELVAKEIPDFTWGYNCSGPDENKDMPLFLAEKCKDGGWMLDEVPCNYSSKTSPFHYWPAYSKRMVGWGDSIRRAGGIYDPFAFFRGITNLLPDIDWLYSSIFRILSGGRVWNHLYKNNCSLAGDLPLLALRFNDSYSGRNLRLQEENQKFIDVKCSPDLWWKNYVFTNKGLAGKDQLIVHLVNSPLGDEIAENPESKIRPPELNVKVECKAREGALPVKAWLLTAEPVTPDQDPKVQAVPLKMEKRGSEAVSVNVPAVLYLKTVVFEF